MYFSYELSAFKLACRLRCTVFLLGESCVAKEKLAALTNIIIDKLAGIQLRAVQRRGGME